MPKNVYAAAEVLIDEFFTADYWERYKYFRSEDPKAARRLKAAAKFYESWQRKHIPDVPKFVAPRRPKAASIT